MKIIFAKIWLNPPNLPTKPDKNTKKSVKLELLNDEIKNNGAILCQVRIKAHCNQSIRIIIWGNQKWTGAIPALIQRERVKIELEKEDIFDL